MGPTPLEWNQNVDCILLIPYSYGSGYDAGIEMLKGIPGFHPHLILPFLIGTPPRTDILAFPSIR